MVEKDASTRDAENKAWQQLWLEHIRKELARQKVNTEFVANPRTLACMTDKTTHTVPILPSQLEATVQEMKQQRAERLAQAKANDAGHQQDDTELKLYETMARFNMAPNEKFSVPVLTSHEVGWDGYKIKMNPRWHKPKGRSPITKYVESYVHSVGQSPFIKKSSGPSS